jgi:hypothetical protein
VRDERRLAHKSFCGIGLLPVRECSTCPAACAGNLAFMTHLHSSCVRAGAARGVDATRSNQPAPSPEHTFLAASVWKACWVCWKPGCEITVMLVTPPLNALRGVGR